jgi:radical SAM superfamily enzyme YgiQ (UPF0313 family)
LPLLYLAGAARNICSEITVFDFNLWQNAEVEFEKVLVDRNPAVVGINCLFSGNFHAVIKIAKQARALLPYAKIVTGGMHPTIWAKQIMENCAEFDAIAIGEGDESFPALLKFYFEGGKTISILDGQGFFIRNGREIVNIPKDHYIANLDTLQTPGYEYFDFAKYKQDGKKKRLVFPLLTSRSCPNQCYFCSMNLVMGTRFRERSAAHTFSEVKYLYETYGAKYFAIMDDNFTFNKKRVMEFCNMVIKNNLNIVMDFPNGLMIRTLDSEVIEALCAAGMLSGALAVESGSDFIRNTILHKGCSKEHIYNVVEEFNKHHIMLTIFLIMGFPEDTEETLSETLTLIEKIDGSLLFSLFKLMTFPGTKLYEQCKRDKLFISEVDENKLMYGDFQLVNPSKALRSLNTGPNSFLIKPYNLSLERLNYYYEKAMALIAEKEALNPFNRAR